MYILQQFTLFLLFWRWFDRHVALELALGVIRLLRVVRYFYDYISNHDVGKELELEWERERTV